MKKTNTTTIKLADRALKWHLIQAKSVGYNRSTQSSKIMVLPMFVVCGVGMEQVQVWLSSSLK